MIHLPRFYKKPKVIFFGPIDSRTIRGGVLVLSWVTKYAWKVKIDDVDSFSFEKSLTQSPDFDKKKFTLVAYGYFKKSTAEIIIKTLPPFKSQNRIFVIQQRKITLANNKVSILKQSLPNSVLLNKIISINAGPGSRSHSNVKVVLPPFDIEQYLDKHNKLLNSPS